MNSGDNITDLPPELQEIMDALQHAQQQADGSYPNGQLGDYDKGELALATGSHNGLVYVCMARPTTWFTIKPETALELAHRLTEYAYRSLFKR